jgi:hypothetical protein
MNLNVSAFRSVKNETVHYSIVIEPKTLFTKDEAVRRAITNVRDKTKQISLELFGIRCLVRDDRYIYDGISKLVLSRCSFPDDSLLAFKNVTTLMLCNITVSSDTIDFSLENLQNLEIISCDTIKKIKSWNQRNPLKRLKIADCESLKSIPPLDNLSKVEIEDSSPSFRSCGNHDSSRASFVSSTCPR